MIKFLSKRNESPPCCTKRLSSNYNQNTNKKTGENRKKLPKSDQHMYNFIKQNYIEVERGAEYMNYQREVALLSDF